MSTGQRVVMLCDWGVKADMVLFAGNTVWSISQRVRGVCVDALYKSTFTLLYFTCINIKQLPTNIVPWIANTRNVTSITIHTLLSNLEQWELHVSVVCCMNEVGICLLSEGLQSEYFLSKANRQATIPCSDNSMYQDGFVLYRLSTIIQWDLTELWRDCGRVVWVQFPGPTTWRVCSRHQQHCRFSRTCS